MSTRAQDERFPSAHESNMLVGSIVIVALAGLAMAHQLAFRRRFGCRFFHSVIALVGMFALPLWVTMVMPAASTGEMRAAYLAWQGQWALLVLKFIGSKIPWPARESGDVGATYPVQYASARMEAVYTAILAGWLLYQGWQSLAAFAFASGIASWLQLAMIAMRQRREEQYIYDARLRGQRVAQGYRDRFGE